MANDRRGDFGAPGGEAAPWLSLWESWHGVSRD